MGAPSPTPELTRSSQYRLIRQLLPHPAAPIEMILIRKGVDADDIVCAWSAVLYDDCHSTHRQPHLPFVAEHQSDDSKNSSNIDDAVIGEDDDVIL